MEFISTSFEFRWVASKYSSSSGMIIVDRWLASELMNMNCCRILIEYESHNGLKSNKTNKQWYLRWIVKTT